MKHQDGVILVTSVVVLFVVSVLTVSFLSLSNTNVRVVTSYLNIEKALYIAEAGISDSAKYIDGGEDFSFTKGFADGQYKVAGKLSSDGSWIITGTGIYKDLQRTIKVNAKEEEDKIKIIKWQEA